jgi:NAD(P)H-dependent flavin oxidoreductase YrpB (nitropropane dioxygenase family)
MLGADGVLLGTRFYASQEAAGFATAKERIVKGTGDQTVRGILFDIARRNVWPAPYTGRLLRNQFSEKWRGRETELLQHQNQEAERRVTSKLQVSSLFPNQRFKPLSDRTINPQFRPQPHISAFGPKQTCRKTRRYWGHAMARKRVCA